MDERVDPQRVIATRRRPACDLRRRDDFLRYQYMLVFGRRAAQ